MKLQVPSLLLPPSDGTSSRQTGRRASSPAQIEELVTHRSKLLVLPAAEESVELDLRAIEKEVLEAGARGGFSSAPFTPLEAERLQRLREFKVLDTAPEAGYEQLVQLAARIFSCPISLVSLVDANRLFFKAEIGLGAKETERDVSFCAHAIHQPDKVFVVPDAKADARFQRNPLVLGEPEIVFYAGAPLVTEDGHAIGTLCIIDRKKRLDISPQDLEVLSVLARQVMTELSLRKALMESQSLKSRVTGLLFNTLPPTVANRLLQLDKARVCDDIEDCTCVFMDLVGFTEWTTKSESARQVVEFLDALFMEFDQIVSDNRATKIKTLGDGYFFVTGAPDWNVHHSLDALVTALQMLRALDDHNRKFGTKMEMRIGVASGKATAGIVGGIRFVYDLFGTTVNSASRLESTGIPGRIQVSKRVMQVCSNFSMFRFTRRGFVFCKGLGEVETYWVEDSSLPSKISEDNDDRRSEL
jgi:adenylate cyclase